MLKILKKTHIHIRVREKHHPVNIGLVIIIILASVITWFLTEYIVYELNQADIAVGEWVSEVRPEARAAPVTITIPSQGTTANANITIDSNNELGPHVHRYERQASQIHTTKGPLDQQLLRDINTTYSRGFLRIDSISTAEGAYNFDHNSDFSMNHSMIQDILAFGAKPIPCFVNMPQWLADTSTTGGVFDRYANPPKDYAKYQKVVYDILSYYKGRYPEIEYIEFGNEPDYKAHLVSIDDYHKMYKSAANAIQQINSTLPQGTSNLKIGGPTVMRFDIGRIQGLINYCQSNNLPLDFISWHNYHNRNNPSYLKSEVEQVRGWLNSAGFNNTETFVTEWQRNTGRTDIPTSAETLQKAAFAAVGNYYWMLGELDIGTFFL